MTKNLYSSGIYNVDHSTFGGLINKRDFDEYHSLSDIATRIISDWNFDKRCRKNAEIRDNFKEKE